MRWVQTVGMKLKPCCCVACGSTPIDPEEGPKPAYFAEGVDVNWGDSVYLCESCVRVLGELAGMEQTEKVDKVKKENLKLKRELKALNEKHEELESKVRRMLDGVKAKREAKAVV